MEKHYLQGSHLRRYAKASWQHRSLRCIHYILDRNESNATPPLHYSTGHQNPTTSISIEIAPQHPHLHKRSLHSSSATLRWISFSAQQFAPPTPHHIFTRYPHWIPTPDPTTTLHIIIPYCHIFPSWFSHCSGITNYTSGAFLPRQRSSVARR